jgi:hypothetical protein
MKNSSNSKANIDSPKDESSIKDSELLFKPDLPEDISKLTKRELLDLIPDEIKEGATLEHLKRLTKQQLIDLVDSTLDQE